MKYAFVILHYLTIDDTVECVKSIQQNVDYQDYAIVIIENGSNNNSFEILTKEFESRKNIFVLESKENLGFAKGNNLGYQFAKETLGAQSIIMINNDTIIEQNDFLSKIDDIYSETNFDILGPDIISLKDQQHQNPYKLKSMDFSEENIKKQIKKRRVSLFLNVTYIQQLMQLIYKKILKRYFKKFREKKRMSQREQFDYGKRIEGYKLHGSCYIFSPNYVKKYNGLYSKTFMYMEEDIMFFIAKKEELFLLYDPEVQIYHKEDSSTNALLTSNRKKLIFIYKHEIHSLNQLYEILKYKSVYELDMYDLKGLDVILK
ncbi:glycosyltransferase [Carnobacterium sp. ISL-102]|uniref:glycosyltransferase n=1 Tax=Carnobacterium sp. ISL-102 TaxID=2819142 RepID=UPI001BE8BE72|nr:glycosyltransferase [Carnobacterium sp. ISL-102]MBT2731092.1 glycosyltransferase family 2 protein [Carnobacterium sp. ISL-102]